jgi:hypothetical protein
MAAARRGCQSAPNTPSVSLREPPPRYAVEDLSAKMRHRKAGELSAKPTEGAFGSASIDSPAPRS